MSDEKPSRPALGADERYLRRFARQYGINAEPDGREERSPPSAEHAEDGQQSESEQ